MSDLDAVFSLSSRHNLLKAKLAAKHRREWAAMVRKMRQEQGDLRQRISAKLGAANVQKTS